MKKVLLTLILMLGMNAMMASPVNPNTASRIAVHFWEATHHSSASAKLTNLPDFPHLYLFEVLDNNSGKGFLIVSADDMAYPVLAYGDSPIVAEGCDSMPANVHFWLSQYENEIAALAAGDVTNDDPKLKAYISHQWQSLYDATWSEPKDANSVIPMVGTSWNQSPYYNYLCPSGTPAGCSAIAMAQVMKFWNHPAMGTGSHSYTSAYGTESANFGNTSYDWDNMPTRLNSSSSMTQVNAVATLCYHVGVSMNMDYGPDGSGAPILGNHNSAESALVDYFGYKNTLHGEYKSQYSDAQWVNMLKADIANGMPIIYAGFDNSAGHAFVFDGYNTTDQFHVNWGWGGAYNGYFTMGALNPTGGGTGTNTSNTFNISNQAIFGVEPLPTLRTNPTYINLARTGDGQTMIVSSNNDDTSSWHAVCDAAWLTISPANGNGGGALTTVTLSATENTTGTDRCATITITQGDDTCLVPVSQLSCYADDMCTLRINMRDQSGDGWEGGYLTLSSKAGSIYGTANIDGGNYGISSISVCPDTVVVTWHKGATDSECGFAIENTDGVLWIHHESNTTLHDGDTFIIADPCGTTGGLDPIYYFLHAEVNDTLYGEVSGAADSIRFGETQTLTAIAHPGYRFTKWNDGSTANPRDFTVINSRTMTARFTSMGDDTLQYDNGTFKAALGTGDDISWGIKFQADDLVGRRTLDRFKFYNVVSGTYTLTVFQGGATAPITVAYTTTFSTTRQQRNKWVDKSITPAIELEHGKTLWITLTQNSGDYPAASTAWCGNEDGSWISTDNGNTWNTLSHYDQYGTWMLRAVMPIDHNLYTLTVLRNRNNRGTVTGGGQYRYGEQVEITATPAEGFYFSHWSDSVTTNPRICTVTGDKTLRAYFEENQQEGIETAGEVRNTLVVANRQLTIGEATGSKVNVFDAMGRCIYNSDHYDSQPIALPNAGVFMVSIDGEPAQKIVAM